MPRVILVSLAIVGFMLAGSPPAMAAGISTVFNTIEVRADQQLALPQWQQVTARALAEHPFYQMCAIASSNCPSRAGIAWQTLLADLAGKDRLDQVRAVNLFANRVRYRSDQEAWGRSDYWATPLEFLGRAGDCEDYAILKYYSLRQLGVPARDMRMVVVQDTVRKLAHAVLVVMVEGHVLVLDNLTNAIMPQERTPQYVPYYSVNEEARWAHLSKKTRRFAVASLKGTGGY